VHNWRHTKRQVVEDRAVIIMSTTSCIAAVALCVLELEVNRHKLSNLAHISLMELTSETASCDHRSTLPEGRNLVTNSSKPPAKVRSIDEVRKKTS
jgi:hypothetical protein